MSPQKKPPASAAKKKKPESHWMRTAREIGSAAVAATLPLIIKAASEALARHAEAPAEKKPPRAKRARRRTPAGK